MPVPDFSPGEVLTAAAMDSIGLWRIDSKALTGSAVDFVGCFTSDYDIYKVFFYNVRASVSGSDFGVRLLSGTTPAITNYSSQRLAVQTTSVIGIGATLTYARTGFLGSNTTSPSNYEVTIFNPVTAIYTTVNSDGQYTDDTNNIAFIENNANIHKTAASYSGLRVYKDTGTFNGGTAVLFGVRT
jgi:hypothetical protein